MLCRLSIRDVVLIDRLELDFTAGLGVLTGETGAGKSILLDSLGLALGARGDAGLVRPGAAKATIAAVFEPPPGHAVFTDAAEHGIDVDEAQLVLRRVVGADGRGRAFVNDQPVSTAVLRRLGSRLVELQAQLDQHGLRDPATHRAMVDAHGAAHGLLGDEPAIAAQAFAVWRIARDTAAAAEAGAAKARANEAYLRHAVDELTALAPQPEEAARLSTQRRALQNAEKLLAGLAEALDQLRGEASTEAALQRAAGPLARLAETAGGAVLAPAVAALDRAGAELEDAAQQLQSIANDVDAEGGTLEQLEERLFALHATARKHETAADRLPQVLAALQAQLATIDDTGDQLLRLAQAADQARRAYVAAAERLRAARQQAAAALDRAIAAELPPLKLERATFETSIERLDEADWGAAGIDRVAFLVATNPGAAPGPIQKVPSGGELSRFMLALKVVLATGDGAPTLVFDEVDAGIGGATAAAVGARLARLATAHQVLVVTHSPQVAALGDHHWRIVKRSDDDGVAVAVAALAGAARREEIARMLSGARVTDEARAAATRLLQGEAPARPAKRSA